MSSNAVFDRVQNIFRSVLRQPQLELELHNTAQDVKGWDSLNHAILLAEVRKEFGVHFTVNEVLALKNVGQMCELVQSKLE